MYWYLKLGALSWLVATSVTAQLSKGYLGWDRVTECDSTQFFDVSGLICLDCPENAEPALDGRHCVCKSSFVIDRTGDGSSSDIVCKACDSGVASLDGLRCVSCDVSDATVLRGSVCACANNADGKGVVADRDETGELFRDGDRFLQRCITCPPDTQPNADKGTCDACEYPKQQISGKCACPATLPAGATCYDSSNLDRIANLLRVNTRQAFRAQAEVELAGGSVSTMSVDNSAPYVNLLDSAVQGCYDNSNRTACNALANLCVLQLYDSGATPCEMFEAIRRLRNDDTYRDSSSPNLEWPLSLPLLTYPVGTASTILEQTTIQSTLRFAGGDLKSNEVSELTFQLAEYTLEGEFAGYVDLTSQLQVCGGSMQYTQLWRRVGTAYNNDCIVDVTQMLVDAQRVAGGPRFYDVYYVDGADPDPRLYPVPVVVKNLAENADDQPTLLSGRLFVVDAESGRAVDAAAPSYVVYPRSVLLRIRMSDRSRERMKTPVLYVEYTARSVKDASDFESRAEFSVRYENSGKASDKFWEAWSVCLGLFCCIGGLLGLMRSYTWSRRQSFVNDNDSDSADALLYLLGEASYCVGLGVSAAALVIGIHALVVFKAQKSAFMFLVGDGDIEPFESTVIAAAVLMGWSTLDMIYRQTQRTDFALVDWEHGKMVVNKDGMDELSAVSCWRSVFLLNEFSELAVQRRTMPAVSFLALVFFVEGLGWKRVALMHAGNMEASDPGLIEHSQILSFGISTSVYLVVVLAQMAVHFLGSRVRLPFLGNLEDPRDSYLDLLYFANVSLYIFDENAAGFYLDGKIKFLHADTSLLKLQSHLKESRTGSTAGRGLAGNNENAFMLFVGRDLHRSYTQEKRKLRRTAAVPKAGKLESLEQALKRVANNESNLLLGAVQAPMSMYRYPKFKYVLMMLIAHGYMLYTGAVKIREPNLWETWMRSVSVRDGTDAAHTVLAFDKFHMWSKTIFYGQELRLVMFELMLFSAIDLDLHNIALSASITWFVGQILCWLRAQLGRTSLSAGTFVNELFLK